MSAWSHLPNAEHIDWVIASVEHHLEVWAATRGAAAPWEAAWDTTWETTSDTTCNAWNAARDAVLGVADVVAWSAARGAILALIVYDDCAHLLNMPSEKLKTWVVLSEQPAAVLLLPAVIAREQIRELNTVLQYSH
jgi:hypothetical protein